MNFTPEYWTKAYNKNISKMVGICYRYVSEQQLAEDLAHDAFMAAMEKSGKFSGIGQFDGWLYRITVNTALQYLRNKQATQLFENLLAEPEMNNDDHLDLIAQANFSQDELLQAINKLPEHHRLVFNMYVIDGFSHAQIAEMLNISEGTSKSNLSRARKQLQEILTEEARKKERRRAALLLLFFPQRKNYIDKLYAKSFKNYNIAPSSTHAINFSSATGHISISSASLLTTSIIGGVIALGGALYIGQDDNSTADIIQPQTTNNVTVIDTTPPCTDSTFVVDTNSIAIQKNDTLPPQKKEKTVVVKRKIIRKKVIVIDSVPNNQQ